MNTSTQTYEKIVKVKNSGKHLVLRISLAMSYLLFFFVWFLSAMQNKELLVPIIVAGALCTLTLALLTWKYVQLEYEYAIWYGRLSVSKIYGKKKRQTVLECDIKKLIMIAPATEENIKRAEHLEPERRIVGVSGEVADNAWLAVTDEQDEKRALIFFEADERMLTILKNANMIAFVRK